MRVAAAQIACVPGDLTANLGKLREFAERAKAADAELVVFPEVADTGYSMAAIRATARSWEEGAVPALCEWAQEFSLSIVCGVAEREGESIYNSQVAIDHAGRVIEKYRKTHLFCGGTTDETACFAPGDRIASFADGELQFGLSICYDLRFPEIYRRLALEDQANVFLVSSAWPFPRDEHLRVLALARAIENQSYLVLANRVGTDAELTFCGGSAIIDPSGVVLVSAGTEKEEVVVADLSPENLCKVREKMAVFAHRRQDLYQ